MRESYLLQFDAFPALKQEIDALKQTVKTQQEALNAVTPIIDELRKENELLKQGLFLDTITNEIGKYKQLYNKCSDDYDSLYKRHELLMSKYIRE